MFIVLCYSWMASPSIKGHRLDQYLQEKKRTSAAGNLSKQSSFSFEQISTYADLFGQDNTFIRFVLPIAHGKAMTHGTTRPISVNLILTRTNT